MRLSINSLSGGKTSSYVAMNYPADYNVFSLVCIDDIVCQPKDRSIIQYVNAKLEKFIPEYGEFIATAEDDKTLYVMRDLEQMLGKEIIWVRGDSFDDVISKGTQTRLPSWARRYCTDKMKLLPIFMWWFHNIGETVNMRIGFRQDEFDRMIRFFNNSDPTNYSIPTSCSLRGERRQKHETFKWRFCEMPLIKDGIDKADVDNYWRRKKIPANLFEPERSLPFPDISNCIHCFHKHEDILTLQAVINENKMAWAAAKEFFPKGQKHMGTWLDNQHTYGQIIENAQNLSEEDVKFLIRRLTKVDGTTCDTGACHD